MERYVSFSVSGKIATVQWVKGWFYCANCNDHHPIIVREIKVPSSQVWRWKKDFQVKYCPLTAYSGR